MPSYLAVFDKLKAKGVNEIWCFAVNDPFVMGAWSRDQKAGGKIRFMGDGSAAYTKQLGLELDLNARGMGMRCQRFSMLVDDGVVKTLNVEGPGKFEVSDGETMLKQLTAGRPLQRFPPAIRITKSTTRIASTRKAIFHHDFGLSPETSPVWPLTRKR